MGAKISFDQGGVVCELMCISVDENVFFVGSIFVLCNLFFKAWL